MNNNIDILKSELIEKLNNTCLNLKELNKKLSSDVPKTVSTAIKRGNSGK